MIVRFLLAILLSCSLGSALSNNVPPTKKSIISGVVIDAVSREAITGALVKIPGTDFFTYTDKDGKFNLEMSVAPESGIVEISLVSFERTTLSIADCISKSLEILLSEK